MKIGRPAAIQAKVFLIELACIFKGRFLAFAFYKCSVPSQGMSLSESVRS